MNNYQKVLPIFAMLLLALCTIVATLATSAAAQTQNEVSQGPLTHENTTTNNITSYVDANSTSIFSVSQARDLILNTICANQACNPDARDFYSIIHLLKWSDVSATNTQTVTAEHWYVYRSGRWYQNQFTDDMRLFGANSIYLLYIHLHVTDSHPYTPQYQIRITKKVPQNLANVFALLQLQSAPAVAAAAYYQGWGGRKVDIGLRPSDIQIDPRAIVPDSTASSGDEISKPQTFNNEGKYWWDISVGVPVKKISQLKFDSTNNTVTPTQTSTQNAFALLDFYLPPVDLAGTNYRFIPHPLAGVAMATQPLHKVLVGGAIGLHYAEVYAGVLFVKQQNLSGLVVGSPGSTQQVTAASTFSFGRQFSVGINLPVRSIVSAVKSKTK